MAETVTLRSGKEFEIIDGALPERAAEELLREASDWLKKGRLDFAREYWQLLAEKGKGSAVARAKAAQERMRKAEYTSFVVLRSGKIVTGKLKAHLRSDLLGLEGKEEILLWQIEEIIAEYHPGYSWVSKSYYPLTLLEIKFRAGERRTSRTTAEIEFEVEGEDGSLSRMVLGNSFEIMRPQDLGGQIEAKTNDRIMKVVMYPDIKRLD